MHTLRHWFSSMALVATLASGAQAAPYSSLVVFGDSLSDSGNIAALLGTNPGQVISGNSYVPPGAPYGSGVYSNGPVWATQFASAAGLELAASEAGGTNYAYGSARLTSGSVPSVQSQINSYLGSLADPITSGSLLVVAGGGNDARDFLQANAVLALTDFSAFQSALGQAAFNYANTVGAMVDALQDAGAEHIVVWNTPNIGITPAALALGPQVAGLGSLVADQMNQALAGRLGSESGVSTFDIYGIAVRAQASGSFTNLSDACGNLLAACNSNLAQALFWDGIHPTTAAHAMIASEMLTLTAAVPEPAEYAMFFAGLLVVGAVVRRQRRG